MKSHYNERRGAWEYVKRFVYQTPDGRKVIVWDVSQRQADLRYCEWWNGQLDEAREKR